MENKFGFNSAANTPMKQIVDYTIPWIYYRLDRDEIDAWVQEMYMESQYENDIRDTKTYKNLSDTIRDYKLLKRVYASKENYYTRDNTKEYIDALGDANMNSRHEEAHEAEKERIRPERRYGNRRK
jgi:hypothetical protein